MALTDKLTAIADAIRAKTGKSDVLTLDQMPLEIEGITGGGSGDAVVWFVTFIGADGLPLWRMPVLDGDDCKDPITHGDISTPTKESTASQVFTYNGWALTEVGVADANALKAVTEDKTVYAAFAESVRTYTVRFFDGETLLATRQVAYGGTATYDATKDNYMHLGWNPEPTNVTEDMDCYAIWMESYSFADASWEYIAQMSESGNASKVFSIGDKKTIEIGTNTVTLIIADFNYDVLASDDTKTAGMTIITDTQYGSYMSFSSLTNVTSYNSTNSLKTRITEAYNNMPSDLQAVIKPVVKLSAYKGSTSSYNTKATYSVWPLSVGEVCTSEAYADCTLDERRQDRRYAIFETPSLLDSSWATTQGRGTWTRSRSLTQTDYWCYFYGKDPTVVSVGYRTNSNYVRFGFCI